MSKQEFSRLDVLLRVQSGSLRVGDACVLIGLQRRQVFRLLRGLKQDGSASLLSIRRGRPSKHRLPAEVRTLALSIVRERYVDYGPTPRLRATVFTQIAPHREWLWRICESLPLDAPWLGEGLGGGEPLPLHAATEGSKTDAAAKIRFG